MIATAILALSAANFIYIAVADLIPGLHRQANAAASLAGIGTIAFSVLGTDRLWKSPSVPSPPAVLATAWGSTTSHPSIAATRASIAPRLPRRSQLSSGRSCSTNKARDWRQWRSPPICKSLTFSSGFPEYLAECWVGRRENRLQDDSHAVVRSHRRDDGAQGAKSSCRHGFPSAEIPLLVTT